MEKNIAEIYDRVVHGIKLFNLYSRRNDKNKAQKFLAYAAEWSVGHIPTGEFPEDSWCWDELRRLISSVGGVVSRDAINGGKISYKIGANGLPCIA